MKKTAYAIIFFMFPFLGLCQLTDNFNDGDITTNPSWSGDTGLWQVLAGQLNSNSPNPSSTFYLSAPCATTNNIEWRIYMNLKFSTSGANYVDFYLASDSLNLNVNGNGYLVRVGGTSDEISLYRKDAGTFIKLIDGIDGRSQPNSSDNKIHLKITRSATNDWILSDDNTGTGLSFVTEGTVNELTYLSGSFTGIAVTQSTPSFFNKHFFDDVYAGTIQVDTTPPALVSGTVISANQLDILFDEAVEPLTAQTQTNYIVNNTLGNPATSLIDGINPALVHLTFSNAFSNGLLNTLTVLNVEDLFNNAIDTITSNFTYFAPVTAAFKDVIINEIFADPSPVIGLPDQEFLEVYNRSNKTFDLNGWQITDGSSIATFPPYMLVPGQFLILCATADTSLFIPFGPVLGLSSFPSLNNDGDNLQLTSQNLVLIDGVNYSDNWYRNLTKKDGGYTLELINPSLPQFCADSANWIASTAVVGGTPGNQNSVFSTVPDNQSPSFTSVLVTDSIHVIVCFNESILQVLLSDTNNYTINQNIGTPAAAIALPGNGCVELTLDIPLTSGLVYTLGQINLTDCFGNPVTEPTINFTYFETSPVDSFDVIINEVLFNPKPNGFDYIEIYNRSQKVFDLSTLRIAGADYNTGILYGSTPFVAAKTLLLPGDYAIVTEDAADIETRYLVANPDKVYEINDVPTFNDDEGIVVILNQSQKIIDAFHYSDNYHFPILKDVEGVSLERLSANRASADATNWHSAAQTAGFGTPTYKNSENSDVNDYGDAFNISPEVFSPDEDGFHDVVNILYHFDTPGYVANVDIYDARGRITRKLVRNNLLGNDGIFSWDGINENLEKASIGIYIIYIELFDKNGDVKKYKKTCVLGGKL